MTARMLFLLLVSFGWMQPAFAVDSNSESNLIPGLGSSSLERIDDYRKQLHRWDRLVRGFRREHSVAFLGGTTLGSWSVRDPRGLPQREASTELMFTRFAYTFHIPWYRGFGYYLGSSFGSNFSERDSGKQAFSIGRSYSLPGVLAGFVLNVTPAFRATLGFDAHLMRVERFMVFDPSGEEKRIGFTTRNLALNAGAEVFFDLKWAIRAEFAMNRVIYKQPEELSQNSPLDAGIGKVERQVGIGLVYHLI